MTQEISLQTPWESQIRNQTLDVFCSDVFGSIVSSLKSPDVW